MKSSSNELRLKRFKVLRLSKTMIVEIISALFILLFAYTAISKVFEIDTFKWMLGKSPLIGEKNAGLLGWTLIGTELAIVLALLIRKFKLIGLYSSLVLMSIFSLYIGYMMAFASELPCSCGGVISTMTWSQHLAFNIFFTLLALTGVLLHRKNNRVAIKEEQPVIFT